MSIGDVNRLESLYLAASELSESERSPYLDQHCSDEPELRREVERLLAVEGQQRGAFAGTALDTTVPERIGPYVVLKLLGRGGMGSVFVAEQTNPKRRVALKVLRQDFFSASARRRFDHEVSTLGRLQHPGIAQIYHAGTFETVLGPQPYFAMELIRGLALLDYAGKEGIGTRKRLELFAGICDAVQHAHQRGVIHRDLKPANILVNQHGQPKILDFGIARATDSDLRTNTGLTDVGQLVGTLAYMSPEQASGSSEELDTRSDVYALGVVLYELLTEKLPYSVETGSLAEAIRTILEEAPAPISASRSALRGDVETIVSKAMEKEKDRRYPSASALAADIRRFLGDEPISARPASNLYHLTKFGKRNKALVGGIIATVLTLTAGLVSTARFARKASERARDVASELAERRRLSDTLLVDELLEETGRLWPRRPELVSRYEDWLTRAKPPLSRLEAHRESLAEIENDLRLAQIEQGIIEEGSPPIWKRGDADQRFRQRTLQGLILKLSGFETQIREIEARLQFASTIEERSLLRHSDGWSEIVSAVAESPQYGGLELRPQLGLIPLGPDPLTKLQEFSHVGSGDEPVRDETGQLVVAEKTGLVFVLIPGGTFSIGAQKRDPTGPNYDPHARPDEAPVRTETLAPYFLSKYEMTQGQWLRITGKNPAYYESGNELANLVFTLTFPVENVNWFDSRKILGWLGLDLPTEVQWEYACRAHTATPWWTGPKRDSLLGTLNIADQAAARIGAGWAQIEDWPELDDGYAATAPVDAYRANPFGLHNLYGNVAEWCADPAVPIRQDRKTDVEGIARIARGGCFNNRAAYARSSSRFEHQPEDRSTLIGVRPALALQP